MTGKLPGIPNMSFPGIDVRDVAKAHLQAILVPEAANQRFILAHSDPVAMRQIAEYLDEKWGKQYPKIPKKNIPKFVMSIFGLFDATAKAAV